MRLYISMINARTEGPPALEDLDASTVERCAKRGKELVAREYREHVMRLVPHGTIGTSPDQALHKVGREDQ